MFSWSFTFYECNLFFSISIPMFRRIQALVQTLMALRYCSFWLLLFMHEVGVIHQVPIETRVLRGSVKHFWSSFIIIIIIIITRRFAGVSDARPSTVSSPFGVRHAGLIYSSAYSSELRLVHTESQPSSLSRVYTVFYWLTAPSCAKDAFL